MVPGAVPDRTSGVSEPDWESWALAEAAHAAFGAAFGGSRGAPALVGLMLDRRKMDGNRARFPCCEPLTNITGLGPDLATCESEGALGAWDAYHGWLAEALAAAARNPRNSRTCTFCNTPLRTHCRSVPVSAR